MRPLNHTNRRDRSVVVEEPPGGWGLRPSDVSPQFFTLSMPGSASKEEVEAGLSLCIAAPPIGV